MGHPPSRSGGRPAGSYRIFPLASPAFLGLPEMRKQGDPQTEEPTVGQCVRMVSSYACELHGSEAANAYRSLVAAARINIDASTSRCPTRYARVPVRQTWTSIDISSHPRPRKGPTGASSCGKTTAIALAWIERVTNLLPVPFREIPRDFLVKISLDRVAYECKCI